MTFLQVLLSLVSFFGIIGLGAGFYSGTNLDGYIDDNWVYVVMLFLGIFSFIAGVVGFYGAKHQSIEYLNTVSHLFITITFFHIGAIHVVMHNIPIFHLSDIFLLIIQYDNQ